LLDGNKEYVATIKLGVSTTTYDKTGEVVAVCGVDITSNDIIHTVKSFLGTQIQLPPIYSALKFNGKPLYYYARNGIEVEIKSREVEFIKLELVELISHDEFKLKIECSKGTYIRSLAHDIGQKLGCGAHLIALKRTKSNKFMLDENITLEYLEGLNQSEREALLLPIDVLVGDLPSINLDVNQYSKIKFGNQFENNSTFYSNEYLKAYFEEHFLGIVKPISSKMFQPVRLINSVLPNTE
ncbi:MAG: tRNA pseudouridine(55) synthase TruB, partial [Burkholderiales bacterium]|nr:tRNA pseudouridine(55) synthase TruB [Burkholderiales bacterium]